MKIVAKNFNAMHAAQEAFIKVNLVKRLDVHSVIRPELSGGTKYLNGDIVFYERNNNTEWRGPGTVVSQDAQQVLVEAW